MKYPTSFPVRAVTFVPLLVGISLALAPFAVHAADSPGTLIFQTGFGPDSTGVPSANDPDAWSDITGRDTAFPDRSDWTADLENRVVSENPLIKTGKFRFFYQDKVGTADERYARIVPDPVDPTNPVLEFHIQKGMVDVALPLGRIQADLYGNIGLHEFSLRYRLRLSSSLRVLEEFPTTFHEASSWLTLAEFWNGIPWDKGTTNHGRIGLVLQKKSGVGQPLRFRASAERGVPGRGFGDMWEETAEHFTIPYDRWMTVEFFLKEGPGRALVNGKPTGAEPPPDEAGRYFLAVTPDGGQRVVVFDRRDWTYDWAKPDGKPHHGWMGLNPMKLYTSRKLVDYVRENSGGQPMSVYWDDFELWHGRPTPR